MRKRRARHCLRDEVTARAEHLEQDLAVLTAQADQRKVHSQKLWMDTALGHQHLPLTGFTYPHGVHLPSQGSPEGILQCLLPKPPLPFSTQTSTTSFGTPHQCSAVEFKILGGNS